MQVAVLDRAGDEPARAADDVPGEGAAEPGQGDRAVRVGWDLLSVEVVAAGVVVDPAGQGGEVVGELLSGAAFSEAGDPALAGQNRGQGRGPTAFTAGEVCRPSGSRTLSRSP